MTLTKQEFIEKYGFPKPYDSKERDMIIKSNLSDIQSGVYTGDSIKQLINVLKNFMFDTEDIRDGN